VLVPHIDRLFSSKTAKTEGFRGVAYSGKFYGLMTVCKLSLVLSFATACEFRNDNFVIFIGDNFACAEECAVTGRKPLRNQGNKFRFRPLWELVATHMNWWH
jgi:hypothetical protein